jgi:hypothetical protein
MREDHLRWLLSAIDRDNAWSDGVPNDPAMWRDWIEAVARVKGTDLSPEANRDIRFAPSR